MVGEWKLYVCVCVRACARMDVYMQTSKLICPGTQFEHKNDRHEYARRFECVFVSN